MDGPASLCVVCDAPTKLSGRLFKCNNCGHGYRVYDGDTIAFHASTYRDRCQRTAREITKGGVTKRFHAARAEIVAQRLDRVGQYIRPGDSVLDVGGGGGTFAMAIKDRVRSVEMTEVNPVFVRHCQRRGLKAHEIEINKMEDGSTFDVVFAWHMLEHCEDVRLAAAKLKRLFTRFLVIEIPVNRGSPESFDGHHHFFTDDSLQRLFGDLIIREYSEGIQAPARFAVFQKQRTVARQIRGTTKAAKKAQQADSRPPGQSTS